MKDYNFEWEDIGDVELGRPNLGLNIHVSVYRLMMYTMRAVLEKEYGNEQAKKLLVDSGRVSGTAFAKNVLNIDLPLSEFIANLHEKLLEFKIGILRVEKSDEENLNFIVTVSEDLDCSGLPIKGTTVCDYDEGFIEGIFNVYTEKKFVVREIDCWSTGDRTCRFTIHPETAEK